MCDNAVVDQWTYLGLEGESVAAIGVHPETPSTIYAVTTRPREQESSENVFRSMDCGRTWNALNVGSPPNITFDPNNPDVIYLNILRSLDNGQTWNIIDGLIGSSGGSSGPLVVNPADSDHLIAGLGTGVHTGRIRESRDFGETWQSISSARTDTLLELPDVLFSHPDNHDLFFIGSAESDNLHRSNDGGDTWQVVLEAPYEDENHPINAYRYWRIDSVPFMPNRVIVLTRSRFEKEVNGVYPHQLTYITEDGGDTWSPWPIMNNQHSNLEFLIHDIAVVNHSNTYLATDQGIMLKRVDNITQVNEGFDLEEDNAPTILELENFPGSDLIYAGTEYAGQEFGGGIYIRKTDE